MANVVSTGLFGIIDAEALAYNATSGASLGPVFRSRRIKMIVLAVASLLLFTGAAGYVFR